MTENSWRRLFSKTMPYLPEFDITDEHGVCGRYTYDESSQTIQKTHFKKIDFHEFEERAEKKQQNMVTLPLLIHIFCQKAGKTVHGSELPRNNPSIRIVQKVVC